MMNLTAILSTVVFFNFNVTTTVIDNSNINTDTNECVSTDTNTNPIIVHNAEVGIFPGDNNQNKTYITKEVISIVPVDLIVSGIKAAEDGKKLIIYATNGSITLLPNNSNSSYGNRIQQSNDMVILQGQAAELTYNTTIAKWVITDKI